MERLGEYVSECEEGGYEVHTCTISTHLHQLRYH